MHKCIAVYVWIVEFVYGLQCLLPSYVCVRVLSSFAKPTVSPYSLPTVRQYADICLFSTAQYKCPVAQLEAE